MTSTDFQPRRAEPLYLQVYSHLRNDILSGRIASGQLITEAAVANKLSVSRTPAREAINLLVNEGLVMTGRNGRLEVYSLSTSDIAETYLLRAAIEPMAARVVAAFASEEDLRLLEEAASRAEVTLSESDVGGPERIVSEVVASNTDFHHALCDLARNRLLIEASRNFKTNMARVRFVSLQEPDRRKESIEGHKEIAAAIRRKEAEKAAEMTEEHIMSAGRRMLLGLQISSKDRSHSAVRYLLER